MARMTDEREPYSRVVVSCPDCAVNVIDSAVGWDNHRCEPKDDPDNAFPTRESQLVALMGPGDSREDKARSPKLQTLEMYAGQLGLGEWTIRLADAYDGALDEDAYVRTEPRERVATIHVNPAANDTQWERLVVHELLHLVLNDLQALAMNDETVSMMDLIDLELERTINRLATAISNIDWEPIHEAVRAAHGFDEPI